MFSKNGLMPVVNGLMPVVRSRQRMAMLLSSCAMSVVFVTFHAHAARLDIPAEDLATAIQKLAMQSGAEIVFSPDVVAGRTSASVVGEYDTETALHVLLDSSGITFERSTSGRLMIIRADLRKAAATMQAPAQIDLTPAPTAVPVGRQDTSSLEEVVVTARRKEEKAQSVPLTLQTFGQAAIENQQVIELKDLEKNIPGLASCCGRGGGSLNYLWIRGVAGALIYFNDVPQLSYLGGGLFFDTGNVQVLKGPQGTLFGQSADGGAILYQPKPTTNNFEGFAEAAVGDYNHREMQGLVNVPIVDDKLIVRAGGLTNHSDGYVKDLTTGLLTGSEDYWIGRTTITVRPTDDIQNDFLVNYYFADGIPLGATPQYLNPKGLFPLVYGPGIFAITGEQARLGHYAFIGGTYRPGGEFASGSNLSVTDTARWDVSEDLTVKNILGYQELDNGPSQSSGFGSSPVEFPLPASRQAQLLSHPLVRQATRVLYSEELQFQGKLLDDKLSYTLGTFDDFVGTRQPVAPTYNAFFNAVTGTASWGDQRTNAVYGQGTYDLSAFVDGLSLTGGYRYTWDKQYLTTWTYTGNGVLAANISNLAYFKAPSYTLSVDYQLSPQTLVYVTNAKGYSKGGFNGSNAAFFPDIASFNPENLNNIEVGVKADWEAFGIKTRTNVAAFYGFYGDVQAPTTALIPSTIPGTPPSTVVITRNAATAHIEGFDAEVTIAPTESLTLSANGEYVHFKFDKWIAYDAGGGPDWSDAPQLYVPQLKYNVTATYQLPVFDWVYPGQDLGNISFVANYSWAMHTYGGLTYPNPFYNINPSYENVDLDLNWKNMFGRSGLSGRAYVTNLLQNVDYAAACSCYTSLGEVVSYAAPPRMWGISVRYEFGSNN